MADTLAPALVPAMFDNSSMWHNFTSWTAQHLAFLNVTKLAPSLDDLVWAGPRMVMKLGRLGSFISFPDAIDGFGQRVIPEATDAGIVFHAATTPPTSAAAEVAAAAAAAAAAAVHSIAAAEDTAAAASASRFSLEGAKGLGSVFSYATSKWALCCIAMAVVLNRTHIFAATRRKLRLSWPHRLVLRIVPIVLFLVQARKLLQSIQCQTSPDFAEMRWGNATKSSDLMFSQTSPFLHGLSSSLLLRPSDLESCRAIKMVPADKLDLAGDLRGSLSLLWPLFGTFCLSQFLETVACAVQGWSVAHETGMTLFEHSLAFAEADAAISSQLGWGLFTSSLGANSTSAARLGSTIAVTRSMIMKRVNTPPEVLLVAFLSAMGHVSSHVLGVFNLQSKFRLVSTGFWALCFMGSIIWSAVSFSMEDPSSHGLLRYPTVCIIGFIPHVLVLTGIFICSFIYTLALVLSALATTGNGETLSYRERLARAHANMQANVSLGDIRIRMNMDFYSALLRAGCGAITMASEAVYLNEDRRVNLKRYTWLEDDRYRELEALRLQWMGSGIPGSPRYDSIGAIALVPVGEGPLESISGYARERAAQKVPKNKTSERFRPIRDGVGAAERSGRWLMALEYMMHIHRLILTSIAVILCRTLAWLGFPNPPRWLLWLARRPKVSRGEDQPGTRAPGGPSDPPSEFIVGSSSSTTRVLIPRQDNVDVENELRRLLRAHNPQNGSQGERDVDRRLYNWFVKGGWWGNTDGSEDYMPTAVDEDLTSVISASDAATTVSESGWESDGDEEYLADGHRTPTQRSPFASRSGSPVHDTPIAPTELARLLNPASPEEREEARTLAAHLSADSVMTRASYKRFTQRQRAQVLATSRGLADFGPGSVAAAVASSKLTLDEEAQLLEQILLSRRRTPHETAAAGAGGGDTWATGAAGLGPDGPQCVVCQSAPRSIIVWPCRCLSLCDDCRVSLAMNNFDKCVCCRREVISFSRIYVP